MPIQKQVTGIDQVDRSQDEVREQLRQIDAVAIMDGVLLEGIVLTAAQSNNVSHKLGRKPRGYIQVDANAQATILTVSKSDRVLVLTPSATVTVSLWVF